MPRKLIFKKMSKFAYATVKLKDSVYYLTQKFDRKKRGQMHWSVHRTHFLFLLKTWCAYNLFSSVRYSASYTSANIIASLVTAWSQFPPVKLLPNCDHRLSCEDWQAVLLFSSVTWFPLSLSLNRINYTFMLC